MEKNKPLLLPAGLFEITEWRQLKNDVFVQSTNLGCCAEIQAGLTTLFDPYGFSVVYTREEFEKQDTPLLPFLRSKTGNLLRMMRAMLDRWPRKGLTPAPLTEDEKLNDHLRKIAVQNFKYFLVVPAEKIIIHRYGHETPRYQLWPSEGK